jgi:hypothetical protein
MRILPTLCSLRLIEDFAMSDNFKPWWVKVGELNSAAEQEQFMRGVGGATPGLDKNILFSLIAGYVGGRIAQRKDSK